MKKVLLSVAVVASMAMVSCGGNEMCECFEMGQEVRKEMKEADGDEDKMAAIEEKYKVQEEACEKLGKALQEEMKDLDEDALKSKREEMAEACPAMKEAMANH